MGTLFPALRASSGPIKERLTISERRAQAEQTLKRLQEAMGAEELIRNRVRAATPSVPQPTPSASTAPNNTTGRRSSDESSAGSSTMHSEQLTYRSDHCSESGTQNQPPGIPVLSVGRQGRRSAYSTDLQSLSESQFSNDDEAESDDSSLGISASVSVLAERVCAEQTLRPSLGQVNPSPLPERPVLRKASSASAMLTARPAAYAVLAIQGHSRTTAALDPATCIMAHPMQLMA
jgi:hypothetical protein